MRRHLFIFFILNIIYNHVDSAGIRCNPPWLKCDDKCISPTYICDGEADCNDLADEKDCRDFTPIPYGIQCATDEFQCEDRSCIPSAKFCDARPDCPDKSDEYASCVKDLKCDTFRCNDGYCVRNEWVCDGVPDCPDSSDETICANRSVPVEECNHEFDRYLCKNQRCISLNVTCNEKDDCGDGSDENILECKKADTSCKQIAKCEHLCRRTPQGARCSCRSGYKLLNNRTCADINECEYFGVCDQLCFNSPGSHECSCHHSYSLNSDMRTCKAEGGEGEMVFSIKSEIRSLYLDNKQYYPVVRDLQHAVAVSLDANYVHWSDIQNGNEAIMRSLVDGSQKEVIVTSGLNSPDDIAVDWVTDNIYFTDSEFMHIGVCNSNGSYCTIVIKERTGKPRGLALLPGNGIMYWAEWGSNSHISKSSMDGKNTSRVVVENLEWPSSLSIDYVNNRLYWIDSKLKLIETVRLDGSDRRTVLKDIAKMPFSLAVFENKLYWSDRASKTIQSCDKFTGKDWEILLTLKSNVYGIHIYHSVLKPKIPNPCNVNSCSQLCLLNSKNGYTCACTLDKELNSDQRTCRAVKKQMHLIVAAGDRFIDYYHELLGKPKTTMSVTLKHATAVTYNPLTDRLLVNDQLTDDIYNFNVNTGDLKAIIRTKDKVLGGMDFDYIGNNLYLSDISHKIIEVHSLSTHEKTVFYFQEEPHAIALVPEKGVMFVVFHSSGKYRIDLMKMHGIGPRTPVEGIKTPLRGPTIALCYDRDSERLFWSDQSTGRIGSTTIKGFVTHIFRTGLSEPVSLAVFDDYVFWTQYKSNQLHWTSKDNTQQYQKSITLEVKKDLERLRLVSLRRTYVNKHECHVNNGNCSHVCLVNNLQSHICACPPGMMLFGNNYICTPQTACKPDEIKCGEHDMCIKLHQRCDGRQDCPNGEDESSVCDEFRLSKCEKGAQFQCKSGECINITSRCNFHYDCPDGDQSDEEDCDEKKCNTDEFQCREGTCVSKYAVCDGNYDCSDFSDEKDCSKHVCDINSFTCENGMCIPKTWKCDGEMDCSDGSDEDETCHKTPCPSEMFTCDNGRCIDMSLKCNAVNDCEDGSDEYYCTGKNSNNIVNCTADEYKCYNSDICVPKEAKCNGVSECPKHDDEHNCVRCQKGQFACYNQNCIDESWVCDQMDDCGDGSDETNCDGSNPRKTIANSNCKEFRCSNGMCLPFEKVCDRIPDCSDQSDEFGKCALSCTMDYPCSTVCHKTPQGPVCDCPIGYQLDSDLKTCKDVNECEHSVCSQICHNNDGSFTCSCYEGYVLRNDKTSCKVAGPQMEIISVTGNTIRKLSASLRSIEIVYEELSEISSIDVNANENTIYWSNDMLGMISKIHINSKIRKTVTGVGRPRALAVDWSTDNVYFTNTEYLGSIKVCNLEEQKCAKLVTIEPRSKAMSIAVHPKQGWLFWSQTTLVLYDKPTSKIYRSDLAGSNVKAIVYHNIGIVSAMVIDHTRSRLYWSDTFLKTIESSNFDGSDRVIYLKTDVYQVLSINIYEDNLYLLMGATATLKKCKLYHDKSCTVFSLDHFNVDKYFTILHTSRQPTVKNTCENHKCEYMCVLGKNTSTCICHNGRLENLKNTCEQDMNVKLKFDSSVANRKGEQIHHKNGLLIGVLVACVIIIIIMFGYYYYQKLKPNIFKKSSVSIYFQNSTYDEQGKFAPSFNSLSTLPPGEHEYVNPVISISKKQDNKLIEKDKNLLVNIGHSDHSDAESEASTYKHNSRLIN
ncbi:vitellogenin receptor-like [Halictus rubicundus]|uniref:vitellogenin receptor-like n=1 Tax=Halictus rubicundus TaxID=77578 RepID=UPI0040361745